MPALCVAADQYFEPKPWQKFEQVGMPVFTAAFHWRNVAAIFIVSWETEPHGNDGDFRLIIKICFAHLQPSAQPVSGWIGKRTARRHRQIARRLTSDQNFCAVRDLKNWFGRAVHVAYA